LSERGKRAIESWGPVFGLVDAYVGESHKSCESEVETAGVLLNIQLLFSSPNKILSHSRFHNFFCPQEKHSSR